MSRIGKHAVAVPAGVTVQVNGQEVTAKGPKGALAVRVVDDLDVALADGKVSVKPRTTSRRARMMWGMQRTLVSNLVEGVSAGFTKTLDIKGVGYRANAQGRNLKLQLGYSHDVDLAVPEGLEVKTPDQTTIEISGTDKQAVGQFAAEIRRWRKPEPYKGKGIAYRGEYIFRKEGKKR